MAQLDLPYFRQDTIYSCGPAVAQMVLRHFGVVYSEAELITVLGTNPQIGTKHDALIELLTGAGLHCYANNDSSLDEVDSYLEQRAPVIVHYLEPSNDEGHFAVVTAVLERLVMLHDPWNGEGFSLPHDEFEARWRSEDARHVRWMAACSDEPFALGRTYRPRV